MSAPHLRRVEELVALGVPRSELVEHVPAVRRDGVLHFSPEHLGPGDGSSDPVSAFDPVDFDAPDAPVCDCVLSTGSFWVGSSLGDLLLSASSEASRPVVDADPVQWWSQYEDARALLREVYSTPSFRNGPWAPAAAEALKALVLRRLVPLQDRLRSDAARALLLDRLDLGPGPLVAGLVTSPVLEDVAVLGSPYEDLVVAAVSHLVLYNQHGGVVLVPESLHAALEDGLPGAVVSSHVVGSAPPPEVWEVFATLWSDSGSGAPGFVPALEAALALSGQ